MLIIVIITLNVSVRLCVKFCALCILPFNLQNTVWFIYCLLYFSKETNGYITKFMVYLKFKLRSVLLKKYTSLLFITLLNVMFFMIVQFSSVQSLSRVTPWTAARQASLSITNSRSLPRLMSIESMMPSNHLNPLSFPSPPALNLPQRQGLFNWVNPSHQVAKVLLLQLQHQSFQWIFRTDFL